MGGLQGDRELRAELGLERLHRRQGARRENDVAYRRFKFVEYGRRVQAQEADHVVPHRSRVFGLLRATVQPSAYARHDLRSDDDTKIIMSHILLIFIIMRTLAHT